MSSSLRNRAARPQAEHSSQHKEAVRSFHEWILEHLKTDTLQKAKVAILAAESEKTFLSNELDAQRKVVKGLTAQNSQMSAQLLKLSSLLTRKGELRNTEEAIPRLEECPRPEYEQVLLLVLQQTFNSSPATIQRISRIHNQEHRLSELANTIKEEVARIVDANNALQAQLDIELNAHGIIVEKDRIINNLELNVEDCQATIQAKDRKIRELQCREQEDSLKINTLTQHFEDLQKRSYGLSNRMETMQACNEGLKQTVDDLQKKISELEKQNHLDAGASEELLAISTGLNTSLSSSNVGLQGIRDDLDNLAAETQTSLIRLANNCDHSVLTSKLVGEEKMCGSDFSELPTISPSDNEAQPISLLQRICASILEPDATIDRLRIYVTNEMPTSISNVALTSGRSQKAAHSASIGVSKGSQSSVDRVAKLRASKSTQTDVSLSQVSKMLINEKRLRDKVSLLENRLRERELAVQSLEKKLAECTERSVWLELWETRVATPPISYVADCDRVDTAAGSTTSYSSSAETQTDPCLSLEAPDPSWPDFQEKMDLFEATLNNLYLALQQQKANAGHDLRIEDLATTIRTQILEALNGTTTASVFTNDRNLDLSIITDDIVDYDRSLLHLQQKKSEQRPGNRGIFPFWK
ncbi:hypothetical protein GL50803_007599 [Giardia duodenalis]|uniref:Uncharacterized protein n=1 Tax=Giardia intestinalis (strain ATCC 50803 / WB clone C6) TaxID=184922 RepID=D3KHT9_GIAIC|nr:hypothetical protein GL50803_007599 [Giardia intestinalis]KAE8304296.1 hypothetical protein GL50803_007599 [Giardia intestinalis]